MAKKNSPQLSVSEEEKGQAQHILEQYHQLANNLHMSEDQQQAETALTDINALPEGAQIALLKELSKEHHVDSADVLIALHELSPLKSVRKEARRSLIQLEGARIYPDWKPSPGQTPAFSLLQPTTNPPRFWKGLVTDTRVENQVQLILFWEQGEDYKGIRILGFYLDLEETGVKDFFTAIDSKRDTEKFIAEVEAKIDVTMKNCSLAHGRRLLLEALAVQEQQGNRLPLEYKSHLSLINQLVIEVPNLAADTDFDEESEESIDLHGLTPKKVVTTFVDAWVDEDYDIAYDLLSNDSSLREGLSRDEWIERRAAWANEVVPDSLDPDFLFEREQPKSKLWLPDLWSVNYAETHKVIEVGWSIELQETPENDTLPELPQATVIYEETKRHWFWVSYTLVQENGEWRIQQMTDEGMNAQNLSVEELQEKNQNFDSEMEEITKKFTTGELMDLKEEEALNAFLQLVMSIMQATSYLDILIKKLPLDSSLYSEAADRMITLGQYERGLAYLIPLAQRFPENRAEHWREIARVQQKISEKYFEEDDDERGELYLELAEQSLHESLAAENTFKAHIALAEMVMEDERLDEAEDHFLQAKELINNDPDEEAHIETQLGEIATDREQYQEAMGHYQRVLELHPDSSEAWFDVGEAHEALEHFEEAESSYKHAIELEPDAIGYYYTFSQLYTKNNRPAQAIEVIEQGLAANPDSTPLHVYLAAIYIESDDYQQAEMLIKKAEQLDPESPLVAGYRQVLNLKKPKQVYTTHKLKKPSKQMKKRR